MNIEQKNLTSKLPFIYAQRCENCGSAKIECRRRVPMVIHQLLSDVESVKNWCNLNRLNNYAIE